MKTFMFLLVTLAISASSGANVQVKPYSISAYDEGEILPVPTECPKVHDPKVTVHIAHETDCDKFYTCNFNGKPHLKVCPSGLHFNPRKQVCDIPESAGCKLIHPTEPTSPKPTTHITEATTPTTEKPTPKPTTPTTEATTPTTEKPTPKPTTPTTEATTPTTEATTSKPTPPTTEATTPTTEETTEEPTTPTHNILINIFIKNSSIVFNSKLI